jgi:DNA-directed RNA polymerase specialized sigma24 family protein
MIMARDDYPTDRELVGGCARNEEEAWNSLFARYEHVLAQAVRSALRRQADDPEVVDRLVGDVRVELFEHQVLAKFNPERGTLASYLAGCARKRVERFLQEEHRRKRYEAPLRHDVPDCPPLDGADLVILEEAVERLPPQPRKYLQMVLSGESSAPKQPATDQERRWMYLIRIMLKNLIRGE